MMANKFWNDHALDNSSVVSAPRSVRVGWLIAVILGVLAGIYVPSCGEDNTPAAQTVVSSLGKRPVPPPVAMTGTELHFYQMEPTCEGKLATYLVVPGRLYTTEMHKVWVCGYRR